MVIEENIDEQHEISDTSTTTEPRGLASGQVDPAMLRYLLTVLCAMLLLYAAPFVLVRSSLYDSVNPSVFARPLNYAFTTAGVNADVVLFGDSTALLGVDPGQMSSTLGLKAINLVNTQPSLVVNDDMTLRRYLASNRPPKLIVFYFAAWDFNYGATNFDARPTYEGQELLLRQGTSGELFAFVKKHPSDAGIFPLKFYATALEMTLHRIPHATQNAQLAATRGHMDNPDLSVLPDSCKFPPLAVDNIRFDWVRSLGARYATPQTKVLFYVAPVPTCTNISSILTRPYNELPAAPPLQVPPGYFSNDVRYVHPLPFAVPQLTEALDDAVRAVLKIDRANTPISAASAKAQHP